MFSEVQRDYIKQLVLSNGGEYPYYLAYTNTNVSNTYSYDDYNFFVILSKEPIRGNNRYRYVIPSDSICLGVRSASGNYSYHSERVVDMSVGSSLNIDKYEFVYTNAEFLSYSLQPDLLASDDVTQSHFDGASIAICIVLLSVVFLSL